MVATRKLTSRKYDNLGQKTLAVEEFVGDKTVETTWDYDGLSRVWQEIIKHNNVAYRTQTWTYDAVGNRTKQICGTQTTTYTYNANDQLTAEQLTDSANAVSDRLTARTYTASRLTQAFRYRGTSAVTANHEQTVHCAYDRQGCLNAVTTSDFDMSHVQVNYEQVSHYYDPRGNLLIKYHSFSPDGDTTFDTRTQYRYVNDLHNPTVLNRLADLNSEDELYNLLPDKWKPLT